MSLTLDPRTCALVIIDLQQGIMAMPVAPHTSEAVAERAARLGKHLTQAGGLVVAVRVGFASDYADKLNQPVDMPMAVPPGGLPEDWALLTPVIAALNAPVQITKHNWSAFYGTELDLQLRRRGITTVIVCGIASNSGVESTARDAWHHNYAVVVAEDACAGLGEDTHRFSMEKVMPRIARVRSTQALIEALPIRC
ncbi:MULTISPECIES: hydrolase [Pseudomonas]|uniref:Hydrolase n=1 Tax=Pseudomonas gingeri TaxID=117681 RepID=A0A7Y7WLZ8_9PSED|nr:MULTISPECIES: hydrolase [Pseudomonas]NWB83677.1 hydrolase [Pseudomonas gingeri]